MIYGNQLHYSQLIILITKLLTDPSQEVYPFILVAGPAHVGKSSMIQDIIAKSDLNPYDIVVMKDLSDDWLSLKESNDLTGTFHPIQIEVESKREDIILPDKSIVHNWGVRKLQERLVRSPIGRDKVVLIEAIERATGAASNALLKTLEEPLPHRLMIATTHSISQLPATITSRAIIFHVDRLNDEEMRGFLNDTYSHLSSSMLDLLLMLSAGRPGLIVGYDRKGQLDELLHYYQQLIKLLNTNSTIAALHQHIMTIYKGGYLGIVLDALLYDERYYDVTLDLIHKQESNVNIENLLFQWVLMVCEIKGS